MNISGVSRCHTATFFGLALALALAASVTRAQADSVTLAWDPSGDPNVLGYNVYVGATSRTYTNIINAGNSTVLTIPNLVPGTTYYFAATMYTLSGLESAYSVETSYTVPGGSTATPITPPTLDPINDVTINENSSLQSVALTGISSGSSNLVQLISIVALSSWPALIPNPTVNYTSPNSTATLTFTPSPNSFGTAWVTVLVDDGAVSNSTVIRSFAVTVAQINHPPTINPIADVALNENAGPQTINLSGISSGATNEIQTLSVTASSSNPALIPNPTVSYSSPNATGTLTLSPATNGSGSATITVTVDDGQTTNNTVSTSFVVSVNPSTTVSAYLTNAVIAPSTTFRFIVPAPYPNGDKFSYSLAPGAPTGVKLSVFRGTPYLTWTPTTAQALTTNLIQIVINDQTNPSLSTNQAVLVTVLDYLGLRLGSPSVTAGQAAVLPIYLSSSSGVTNLTFSMDWPASGFVNPTLFISAPGISSSSLVNQQTNLLITLQTAAGQVLQKSNLIAQVSFQTLAAQPSGFVSVSAHNLYASKPDGTAYINYMPVPGEVAVISTKPLLAPALTTVTNRTLTAFGNVGTTYQLQCSTSASGSGSWVPVLTYTQTNISQTLSVDPSVPFALYRLQAP